MKLARIILSCSVALAMSCGDKGVKDRDTAARPSGEEPARTAAPTRAEEGPGGEMLLGLAVPEPAGARATAKIDTAPKAAPAGREELRADFEKALAEDRVDEAVATADVLNLLFPNDAELLELRGRALGRQGDGDGLARDLARCCELGRASCCRGDPR